MIIKEITPQLDLDSRAVFELLSNRDLVISNHFLSTKSIEGTRKFTRRIGLLMTHFSERLEAHLGAIKLSAYRLAKLSGIHEQHMYKIARGERRPTDEILAKFAAVPEMQVVLPTLLGWRALDDYPPEVLLKALEADLGTEELKAMLKKILGEQKK